MARFTVDIVDGALSFNSTDLEKLPQPERLRLLLVEAVLEWFKEVTEEALVTEEE